MSSTNKHWYQFKPKMLKFKCFFFIPFCSFYIATAQRYIFSPSLTPIITINDQKLTNAWAGGLNSIQVNKMCLDNDTIEDLVLFDKTTNKISTYLAINQQYVYTPEYEFFFPRIQSFLILADYNCDGKKDIYTKGLISTSVSIFKNISGDYPKWKLMTSQLMSLNKNNDLDPVSVGYLDLPAVTDMDGDGDNDILVYNSLGYSGIVFHRNNSIENYTTCDSIIFETYTTCWGRFNIGYNCNNLIQLNQSCPGNFGTHDYGRAMHNGSTITVLDLDGNGLKDLIIGDVSCNNVNALINTGDNLIGKVTTFSPNFPDSHPIDIYSFPSVFYEDVDFDGNKDLLAAPTLISNDDQGADLVNSLSFYKNTGTNSFPGFSFVKNNFLQDEMIDFGENAHPSLADYDADGDLDLFVGNRGKLHGSSYYSSVLLLENIGTKDTAIFKLKDEDFLQLSTLNRISIKPNFYDINNDGSLDLYFLSYDKVIGGTSISYLLNKNGKNHPFYFSLEEKKTLVINTGSASDYLQQYDTPFITNINEDSASELLIGKYNGELQLYKNTGTFDQPLYTIQKNSFGGIKSDFNKQGLVCIYTNINNNDTLELISIDYSGKLKIYPFYKKITDTLITNNITITGKFKNPDSLVIYNKLNKTAYSTTWGSDLSLASGDFNNDSIQDLVIGTGAGGLLFLKNLRKDSLIVIIPTVPGFDPDPDPPVSTVPSNINDNKSIDRLVNVFPNPLSTDNLNVYSQIEARVTIINQLGQPVLAEFTIWKDQTLVIDLKTLTKGVYYLKIFTSFGTRTKKIIRL